MKELDKSKVYYLGDLTNDQLKELYKYLCSISEEWNHGKDSLFSSKYLIFTNDYIKEGEWLLNDFYDKYKSISVNAKELFEDKTLCQAYKEKTNKLNYELDFNFITQLAERMASNKGKYEPYNWQKLDNVEDLKQALFRHVIEVMKGNYKDDNRLFGHLEAIALNSMFINYQLNKE